MRQPHDDEGPLRAKIARLRSELDAATDERDNHKANAAHRMEATERTMRLIREAITRLRSELDAATAVVEAIGSLEWDLWDGHLIPEEPDEDNPTAHCFECEVPFPCSVARLHDAYLAALPAYPIVSGPKCECGHTRFNHDAGRRYCLLCDCRDYRAAHPTEGGETA